MLRLVNVLILLLGLGAGAWDAAASGPFRFRDVGELWFRIHPDSLQLAQPAVERHLAPFLWDPVILTLLTLPAAPLFLGLAAALFMLRRMFG